MMVLILVNYRKANQEGGELKGYNKPKLLRAAIEDLSYIQKYPHTDYYTYTHKHESAYASTLTCIRARIYTHMGPDERSVGTYVTLEDVTRDALPTFPDAEAFACIERELGLPLDSIYSALSPSPIAAASLGQVYKAQLRLSGELVAVKVQRPGIEEAIGLDFYLLRGLGFLINKYVDFITSDVVALIDEFARRVYQELNYVQEGKNARRFKKLYADKADVLVPDIFWDYTSAKVLTMEWVDGVKLNQQEAIEKQGLKLLELVNIGIQCSLRQLLEYGYFHADPHPGNLLATPEGKLAFLDFGMMSETPEQARFAIIGHVVHLVNRDYEAMARDYYDLDFLSPDVDVSPIVPALRNFFDDVLNATVSELNFKTIVDGLGAVLYDYPFNVPAYYALILRSLTVLEGLALYADPNFKVLAASYPYFAKRLLTDPNPYLRDALIELLFKDGRFRQGRKDEDFTAKDALQPVLKLLLDPEGEELRVLVVKESVCVAEAVVFGSMIDTFNSIPQPMRSLISNDNESAPLNLNNGERERILELRDRVFRIWSLLRSSDNFDPTLFEPILQNQFTTIHEKMDGKFAALEDLMKKMLEEKQKSATSESKETTGGHERGGNPNPFRVRENSEVEVLEGDDEMPPLESLSREEMSMGYDRRVADFVGRREEFHRRGADFEGKREEFHLRCADFEGRRGIR
ncbi:hypothetical protein M5K25_009229 [Dendrobium thyrsiflorum]|uniref:Protein kinase domain-containing protein n=1 Tax=Dendrobium thyrsiflorum TaxID=117978 RepID=A0ABD0V597_DENTH